MTRLFPAFRLLQQTPNGWIQHLNNNNNNISSRVLGENMVVNNVISNVMINVSGTPVGIVCHRARNQPGSGIFLHDNPFNHTFPLIMFNLLLVTTITRFFRFVLKPLRQPKVISQIIGGVIVGPSLLGRNKWFRHHIQPESTQFLMNNFGVMGFMFFSFIYGVKVDPGLLKKSGKVHVAMAMISICVPIVAVFIAAMMMRKNMNKDLAAISSIGVIAGYLGITAFPVLFNVLKELNLLNSDMGRMALSLALICDALGVVALMVFEAGRQGETRPISALWYTISLVGVVLVLLFCIRPMLIWVNKKASEGHPIDEKFVVVILLGVFVLGFITDLFGIAIVNGSFWLGLVVPDGPRLGATIVQKSKTVMIELLMPFAFVLVGNYTDISKLNDTEWSNLEPLFVMVLIGYLTKFISTWLATIYWQMPVRDGLALSLVMSLRGQVELILFVHLMDKRILRIPGFTLLVLMTTALTAAITPLISILYDPTRPYMVSQRRNLQHNPPDKELGIVLCVLDVDETITGLIHLLDVTYPSTNSPLSIYALRLIDLIGRATPLFIDHSKQEVPEIYQWTHSIHALQQFQQPKMDQVKLKFFTGVCPKQTMFQEVCEVALEYEASLIILPFKRSGFQNHGVGTVNTQVLNHAPCSVAILVDKGLVEISVASSAGGSFSHYGIRVAVFFLGGADAREALVYADRMVSNQDVSLTVIRFLSHNNIGDNEMEKKLDDGIVTWFWVKNEANQRVLYREVVVRNGEETIGAIQTMNDGGFDLLIVGRKQGINPVLLTGVSEWSENEELGYIGDYVSSDDFSGTSSVLVVQQQILRG